MGILKLLAQMTGLPVGAVRPVKARVYRQNAPGHFSVLHTDEASKVIYEVGYVDGRRTVKRKMLARSLVSVVVNLGEANNNLVWCQPYARRLFTPLGSLTVFRISNISEHAVLPKVPDGEAQDRITIQIIYGGPLTGGGARPVSFHWSRGAPLLETFF